MRNLTLTEELELKAFMENKGLGKRSIDSYMTSIRKASDFFEFSILTLMRSLRSLDGCENSKELGDYVHRIFIKANPSMSEKHASDFKSHMRMTASFVASQVQVAA
jgi:hypothetical protein